MYKITKIAINEGSTSAVKVGATAESKEIKIIRIVSHDELKEGDEVYVGNNWANFIKTSPLKRIAKVDDQTTTLWTQTSIYHLEKLEGE